MPRGGKRPNAGRKRFSNAGLVETRQVTLTPERRKRIDAALEPLEKFNEFCHEALDVLPRYRKAIAEIEGMIRGCDISLSSAHGNYADTVKRQRATLEFVLGLLKPPAARRRTGGKT